MEDFCSSVRNRKQKFTQPFNTEVKDEINEVFHNSKRSKKRPSTSHDKRPKKCQNKGSNGSIFCTVDPFAPRITARALIIVTFYCSLYDMLEGFTKIFLSCSTWDLVFMDFKGLKKTALYAILHFMHWY